MTKTSKKNFWRIYGIYMLILLVLAVIILVYVWNTMKKYQKYQPENKIQEVISTLESGDVSSVTFSGSSKFEPQVDFSEEFADQVKGANLSYETKTTKGEEITYRILKEEQKIAEVTIKGENKKNILGILSIFDWKVSEIEAVSQPGTINVKITIPSNYTAFINGVELTKDEQSGEEKPVDGMQYVAEYIKAPSVVTYKVSDLKNQPLVTVKDINGNDVDMSGYQDLSDITVNYPESEMPAELRDYALKAAMDYSNFFSRDLPGCSESTACLQPYFPQGSYYITLAEQYRNEDMWMYNAHTAPEFSNIQVTQYRQYATDCFSCRISFDKTMYLTRTGNTTTDHVDQTFFFVNIDGNWLISDMKSEVE